MTRKDVKPEQKISLNVKVDRLYKESAKRILGKLGLSLSAAVNIYLRQICMSGCIPFEVGLPGFQRNEDVRKLSDGEKAVYLEARFEEREAELNAREALLNAEEARTQAIRNLLKKMKYEIRDRTPFSPLWREIPDDLLAETPLKDWSKAKRKKGDENPPILPA